LWSKAIPAEQKIKEIEEGMVPDFIETMNNPKEIQTLEMKLVRSANSKLLIIFPAINTFHRQEHNGVITPKNSTDFLLLTSLCHSISLNIQLIHLCPCRLLLSDYNLDLMQLGYYYWYYCCRSPDTRISVIIMTLL
jgi:hypothetical protein